MNVQFNTKSRRLLTIICVAQTMSNGSVYDNSFNKNAQLDNRLDTPTRRWLQEIVSQAGGFG
jgi:hypothetical protein